MKHLYLILGLLLISPTTLAQNPEDYYGGWIADAGGVRHIYYIVIRHGQVTGYYCHDCEDPANLAFIDDGSLTRRGLSFILYHYPDNGAPYREEVTAVLRDGNLELSREREFPATTTSTMVLHREPPPVEAAPIDRKPNQPLPAGPVVLPGAAETVTPERVEGLWLFGAGPGKQYFIFRQHKGGLRGMACGPCDSVRAMAPLEAITWSGTRLQFEIIHEDNGFGVEEYGPFSNITEAVISKHEMHMSVVASFDPEAEPVTMTLLGPVQP